MFSSVVHTLTHNFRNATRIVRVQLKVPLEPHQVLVKVLYAGVNASDVSFRTFFARSDLLIRIKAITLQFLDCVNCIRFSLDKATNWSAFKSVAFRRIRFLILTPIIRTFTICDFLMLHSTLKIEEVIFIDIKQNMSASYILSTLVRWVNRMTFCG